MNTRGDRLNELQSTIETARSRMLSDSSLLVRQRGLWAQQIGSQVEGVADKLLADIGDVVQLMTANGEPLPLKVVGFFQSGIADYDKVQSYASIAPLKNCLDNPTAMSPIFRLNCKT